ncbi:MAG: type IV secretory system conjugative DNA transfer family protein [Rhodocyclaceae bacterium]|nr:type IV secretory system conjugative DNA transfer family protein [Rhodocyclaceae bacterium]
MALRTPSINLSALKLPETLPNPGLLVGWSLEHEHPHRAIGFHYGEPEKSPKTGYVDPIQLSREGHLITLAPTGAGKGVGCIIPALLLHDGPVIVIDPKGENVAVTARRRREMGHEVIVIDPMGITGFESASLNPLDLVDVESPMAIDDVAAIVETLWHSHGTAARDQFWVGRAKHLVTALVLHTLIVEPPERRNFDTVRALIAQTVTAGNPQPGNGHSGLLQILAESLHPEVRRIAGSILVPARETFGSIASFAQELTDFLRGPVLAQATGSTSFSLDAVTRGDPLSIYLVLPPHMLESHGRVLRLWISTLIGAVTRRRRKPERSTLFILDEAAQLGALPQLRQAITLLRGYGLQTWSFWQDKSQLQMLYPHDWKTMVNNCRVLQCFGALNMNASRDIAEMTGFDTPEAVLDLREDEMVLQLAGDDAVVARVPNYLKDEPFIGLYDENPYYSNQGSVMPRPHPMGRYFSRGQSWAEKTNGKEGAAHPLPDTGPDALLNRLLAREARKR